MNKNMDKSKNFNEAFNEHGLQLSEYKKILVRAKRDITTAVIPDSVVEIGPWAFYRCSSLTSINIPDSVTSISFGAFSGCTSLTSVVISDNMTSIGALAFSRCDSLKSITIPDGVTSIGPSAFESCLSLESVVIGQGVNSIGESAFFNCNSLIVKTNNPYVVEYCEQNKIRYEIPDEESVYLENLDIAEDIEKHDELNPKLFEGNNLRQDVKIALLDIVNAFVGEFKENNIDIKIKDAVIIGSNVSYNYTKDSDLDLHIIADTKNSKYSEDLLTLLYSAYRSIFNKNYDITIKGIPCEVYIELDSVQANSNGIYSLYSGWIKEPEHKDIPDIDKEEFDKLFKQWEDKYFNLLDGKVDTKNSLNENYNSLPFRKYRLEDEDEAFITYIEDEKDLIKYVSHHPEVAYIILYQLSGYPGYEDLYEISYLWDSECDTLQDLIQILGVDYDEESIFIEAMHPEIKLGWRGAGNRYLLDADTLTNYKAGDIVEIEIGPNLPPLEYEVEDGSYLDDEAIEDSKWHNDVACRLSLKNGQEVSEYLEKKLKSDITSDIEKNIKNKYLKIRFGGSSSGFPDFISVSLPCDKRIIRGDHEDDALFDAE